MEAQQLHRISGLAGRARRSVYELVAASYPDAVDRDRVAAALSISRSLAAFHLDRLAADGFVEVSFARRSGRTGPGAGRPAKFYRRGRSETTVSVPARNYELAARVLAHAVAGPTGRRAAEASGHAEGIRVAEQALAADGGTTLLAVLEQSGFEPVTENGSTRLRNCPFAALTAELDSVVCSMTRELVTGAAERLSSEARVRAQPSPGFCCVVVDESATHGTR